MKAISFLLCLIGAWSQVPACATALNATELSAPTYTFYEAHGNFIIGLTRTGPSEQSRQVQWQVDESTDPVRDLLSVSGVATFQANSTFATILLQTKDDSIWRANRTHTLLISSKDPELEISGRAEATLTIRENDLPGFPGPAANAGVVSIFPLAGNDSIVYGNFSLLNGVPSPLIGKLRADQTLDRSFNLETQGYPLSQSGVRDVLPFPNGNFIILRVFNGIPSTESRPYLMKSEPNGAQDVSFQPPPTFPALPFALAHGSDSSVLVSGGGFRALNGIDVTGPARNRGVVVRLRANGAQDLEFRTPTAGANPGIKSASNGQFYLYGGVTAALTPYNYGFNDPQTVRGGLFRMNAAGTLDLSFDAGIVFPYQYPPAPSDIVKGIQLYPDGRILAWGAFTTIHNSPTLGLARLSQSGQLDVAFAEKIRLGLGEISIDNVALSASGKIGVVPVGIDHEFLILDGDGALLHRHTAGRSSFPYMPVRALDSGAFILGGDFTFITSNNSAFPRFRLAAFTPHGALSHFPTSALSGGLSANGERVLAIYSLAAQSSSLYRSADLNQWDFVRSIDLAAGEQTLPVDEMGPILFYRLGP